MNISLTLVNDLIDDKVCENMSDGPCERIRFGDDGELDEITANNVSVQIERMRDGHIWISIERGNVAQIVNLFTARGAKIIGTTVQETYVAKLPVKYSKPMKGIPIGSFDQVVDAAGKAILKPRVNRKTSVSAKIAMRKSKKVKPVRRAR